MHRSVVWFKRDLRVDDHAPLRDAAHRGQVGAIYVYEPIVLLAPQHDAAHLLFVNQSLARLRDDLRSRGGELFIARGPMPETLDALHTHWPFDALFSHEETGLDATFQRDRAVAAWCARRGVAWHERPQFGVVRPLRDRDGWAARWRERMAPPPQPAPPHLIAPDPAHLAPAGFLPAHTLPSPAELALPPTTITSAQPGGSHHALDLLDTFLHHRGLSYQRAMSSPLDGADACSRLSPHIAYGTISLRRIYHATLARQRQLDAAPAAPRWSGALTSFHKRLRWHCHFMQKLEDEPALEFRNFNRAYDGLRQEDPAALGDEDRRRLDAFRTGRTGYPFVDACLRSLARTGWINFRMRAMLMSFAAYHLWLHWRAPAEHLARVFLDFEPGIHYPQCQMQSGVTGINTIRIYSPLKQAHDQDPSGTFTRRWVPELEHVPDEFLAQPWRMPALTQRLARCEIGADYPAPIVDHAQAYRAAQRAIFALRATPQAREQARRVYLKHGSRRRPEARTPRAPRRPGAGPGDPPC